jgi:hypothetical protein
VNPNPNPNLNQKNFAAAVLAPVPESKSLEPAAAPIARTVLVAAADLFPGSRRYQATLDPDWSNIIDHVGPLMLH